MEEVKLTCINCPMGCELTVKKNDGGNLMVTGNQCAAGVRYANEEMTNPTRNITTSVRVTDDNASGETVMLSVKTEKPVPKGKIMDCIQAIREVEVHAPVEIGDVVMENVAGTGVRILATRKVG